ncbi:hypothetical protein [Allopontixanthobacter sediminis]|uniref:hypothetical protein n=1 Tax=Allopontixanthobacter sediminis TaxID=1689985 RepID=UPI002FCDA876
MKHLRAASTLSPALLACAALAACVPRPVETPPPVSQPAPTPAPAPPPAAVITAPQNWMDAPATPGNWTYRATPGGSQALFGQMETDALLTIQCTRGAGQVLIVRAGNAAGPVPMRILTETQARALTASPNPGAMPSLIAALPARDPLLDAMALSKGRIAVETTGLPTVYAPSWPEISRVIEDCR